MLERFQGIYVNTNKTLRQPGKQTQANPKAHQHQLEDDTRGLSFSQTYNIPTPFMMWCISIVPSANQALYMFKVMAFSHFYWLFYAFVIQTLNVKFMKNDYTIPIHILFHVLIFWSSSSQHGWSSVFSTFVEYFKIPFVKWYIRITLGAILIFFTILFHRLNLTHPHHFKAMSW